MVFFKGDRKQNKEGGNAWKQYVKEHVAGDTTYTYQLRAFVQAITRGIPVPTDPIEAIANMRVIDAVYRQAGLHPRAWAEAVCYF
jgi:hypothetical protein